jgi:phosphocarrier protein
MKSFTYRIDDPNGMHARPAGKLATYAKQFDCDVRVRCKDREADAKRLLSLMSLGAGCGEELHFQLVGADEEEACRMLEAFCNKNWNGGDGV